MNKSVNLLIVFLVLFTLLAFAAVMLYSFYLSLFGDSQLSERLTYVANTLTGLVGGIVASAFSVELPPAPDPPTMSKYSRKMSVVGNLVMTGKFKGNSAPDRAKGILGNIYAWVYLLLGISAIVLWSLDQSRLNVLDNLATITLGLILVIVKNFLD